MDRYLFFDEYCQYGQTLPLLECKENATLAPNISRFTMNRDYMSIKNKDLAQSPAVPLNAMNDMRQNCYKMAKTRSSVGLKL